MFNKCIGIVAAVFSLYSQALGAQSPATIPNNTLSLGKTGSVDKTLEFNLTKAGAAANPKIKYDNTSSKLKFSNDGTNFKDIGSGGGGSVNYLVNGDFELSPYSSSWTITNSTGTVETTQITEGKQSANLSLSSQAGDLLVQSVTPSVQTTSQNFEASCRINTSLTTVQLCSMVNGVEQQCQNVSSTGSFGQVISNFVAPTSGTSIGVKVKVTSSSTGTIYVDDCYVGQARNISQVNQAVLIGSVVVTGCSSSWTVANASFTAFTAQTGCSYSTSGRAAADTDFGTTQLPAIKFASLPIGDYLIVYDSLWGSSTSGQSAYLQVYDGTNVSTENPVATGSTSGYGGNTATFSLKYTAPQSNVTLQFRGKATGGSSAVISGTTGNPGVIKVYYFPTSSQQAISMSSSGWKVDANISGANPSLGTSNVTSYTGIENGSLTLSNNSGNGNIVAQIPCSSTNSSSGTTCSSGNESVGVSFNLPNAGDVIACVSFSHELVNSSGTETTTFQIVETPNNAQTISQEGKTRTSDSISSTSATNMYPHRNCGNFTFSSSGKKTLRLMYEQGVGSLTSSSVIADANASYGQRDIHWEVYPLNYLVNAPILVGSVTSNSLGAERIERITIAESSSCTSNPCTITRQSGSWVSSVSWNSTGDMTLNINSGIFSSPPTCTGSSSQLGFTIGTTPTTTSFNYVTRNSAATPGASSNINIVCMGPK